MDYCILSLDYHAIQNNLSERLEQALGTSAPLLKEVFIDFSSYLTKTLLGTKGQELLSGGESEGLKCSRYDLYS